MLRPNSQLGEAAKKGFRNYNVAMASVEMPLEHGGYRAHKQAARASTGPTAEQKEASAAAR